MRRQRDTVRYAQELLDLRLHRNQDRAQRGPQPRCSQAEHQVLDKRVDRRAADVVAGVEGLDRGRERCLLDQDHQMYRDLIQMVGVVVGRYRRKLWMSPWHENAAYLPP